MLHCVLFTLYIHFKYFKKRMLFNRNKHSQKLIFSVFFITSHLYFPHVKRIMTSFQNITFTA